MYPRVSVVMPCLNSAEHVRSAIASVQAQTLEAFELLVIDNGSTDRTTEIVQSVQDSRIRLLHQPEPGVSHARNLGIAAAQAKLLAFLDSDDRWHPDFLLRMAAELEAHPEAVLAYCGWQNVGLPGARGAPFIPADYEGSRKMLSLLEGCRWPIHACLTYRELVLQAGGFDTSLQVGEDYLLWLEISSAGRIVRVPEVLAQYHHHSGVQATKDRGRAAIDTFRAKRKFLQNQTALANYFSRNDIERSTWGLLLRDANELYWRGDLDGARNAYRMLLLRGYGTFDDKLRMLPSILPKSAHRLITNARARFFGK